MENAWNCLAQGQKSEAQKCFAVSTSRINGDFVYFIFHHLRQKGCDVLMAPYFAGAQLAHFAEKNVVQAVFGPPGLLLYNVQRVVITLEFPSQTFEWVDLQHVLNKWSITKDQFIDACMLAGTEYCLTYPYLAHGQQPQGQRFNFEIAVDFIKRAPIIHYMANFPTEEMKTDHVDGYCTCKVLVQSSPVLQSSDGDVRPMGGAGAQAADGVSVPKDFSHIMGEKLPNALYFLMMQGVISHKIPQALARGEWVDKSQPLVDTKEFRQLLIELNEYRQKSVSLVAKHLHKSFSKKTITCKAFWDNQSQRNGQPPPQDPEGPRLLDLKAVPKRLKWIVSKEKLQAEMKRQERTEVDLKFCLTWHTHEFNNDGELVTELTKFGPSSYSEDKDCLSATVHFMLLEHLEIIAGDGNATVFGNVLKDSPKHLFEPCLVAIELLKFEMLNGEPFEPGVAGKRFPPGIKYPVAPVDEWTKSRLLLTRVMSLVPMRLKTDMWNADVNFDLAAFHSMVRILKRALRQLTEASLASVLMKDLKRVKLLPSGFLCSTPKKDDHLQTMGLLPTFMLPRTCTGIVVDYFLEYQGEPSKFIPELQAKFPCCTHARQDLLQAFIFWEEMIRLTESMVEGGLMEEDDGFPQDMRTAGNYLKRQQQALGLIPDPSCLRGDEHPAVKAACSGLQN